MVVAIEAVDGIVLVEQKNLPESGLRGHSWSIIGLPLKSFRISGEGPLTPIDFGKSCVSNPFMFSFVPRCQGLARTGKKSVSS